MEKLASLTGYTIGSAGVTFGKIKAKIKLLGESLSANGPSTPKKAGGPGRGKAATLTPSSTPKKRGGGAPSSTTPAKRPRKGATARQPTSSPCEDVSAADDDDGDEDFGLGGAKVKKEEPSFEQGSGFYDETLEECETGGGASYGFLDGIEKFGGGGGSGGRSASNGYRKPFAKDAE